MHNMTLCMVGSHKHFFCTTKSLSNIVKMIWRVDLFFFFLNSSFFLSMHVSNICVRIIVRVTFAICKNKGRVSVSLICTGLSNAWLECLWWEESYIWCWWDPWHFAQGKASLGNANQPTNGAFFCVFFTFLDLFLPSILPFLTKQDWVRFSFGPLICCTSHSQSQQTQTGSEIMLAKGWHKPREKDHTELITLAADQLLVF